MSRCSFITLSLLLIAYYYWSYQFFLAQPEPNNAAIPLQVANQHHGSVEDSVKRELQLGQDGDAVKNAGAPRPDDRWEVDDNEPAAGQNRAGPDVPEDEGKRTTIEATQPEVSIRVAIIQVFIVAAKITIVACSETVNLTLFHKTPYVISHYDKVHDLR